jgi:hypothetical protein
MMDDDADGKVTAPGAIEMLYLPSQYPFRASRLF